MWCQKTRHFFSAFFLLLLTGGLLAAVNGFAQNRAEDLYLQAGVEEWIVVLKTNEPVGYSLFSVSPEKLILSLKGATSTPRLLKRIAAWRQVVVKPSGKDDLSIVFTFPKPFREVRSRRNTEKGLITLRFFLKKGGREKREPFLAEKCTLEDLRFGNRSTFLRTVMDLTARPAWRFSPGEKECSITLKGVQSGIPSKKMVSRKGIRAVRLQRESGAFRITLQFENPEAGFRLFWLAEGSRLVLDSYRTLDTAFTGNTSLPPWLGRVDDPPSKEVGEKPPPPSLVREAMPEVAPVMVQEPLVGFSEKRKKSPGTAAKPLRVSTADQSDEAGPKVTVTMPQKQVTAQHLEEQGGSVQKGACGKAKETKDRKKSPLTFESKEAALYGAILQARDLQDRDQALHLIGTFLVSYPDSDISDQLRFMKADLLRSALDEGKPGMLGKVVAAYQEVINKASDADLALQAYVNMAKAYAKSGNHYLGISCLDLAIRRHEGKQGLGGVYLERGLLYLEKNLAEKAVRDFETVLHKYPKPELSAQALFGIARYLQARGLYAEAQKRLAKVEQILPQFALEQPDFIAMQAQNYLYLKEYEKARSSFYEAINLGNQQEGNDLLFVHIGDTFLQESKRKRAEKFYALVKEKYPNTEGAALAELRLGELQKDIKTFEEVKKRDPGSSVAQIATLKVANAYFNAGLFLKTMESLKDLAAEPPEDSMVGAARTLFARAAEQAMEDFYTKGKFDELVQLFQKNETLLKGTIRADSEILVARSLQEMKEYDRAISAYRKVDLSDLSDAKTKMYYLGIADCLSRSGVPQESIDFLEKARENAVAPVAKRAVTSALAERYEKEGRYEKAAALYNQMIQWKDAASPRELAQLYLSMGKVLNAQKKYGKARDFLNRSLAVSEERQGLKAAYLSGLRATGEGYLGENNYRGALDAFTRALRNGYAQSNPGFWEVKLDQAQALLGLNRYTAAEEVLNQVYEGRGPDQRYWDLRYRLATKCVTAGHLQTGEKLLQEISEEGTPTLQSNAQIKLGALRLQKELEKLSIWPQIGGQEQRHVRE